MPADHPLDFGECSGCVDFCSCRSVSCRKQLSELVAHLKTLCVGAVIWELIRDKITFCVLVPAGPASGPGWSFGGPVKRSHTNTPCSAVCRVVRPS
jgi:hypothetical protein